MPLSTSSFRQRLEAWRGAGASPVLRDIRIGLEREALRVDAEAGLSRQPHPRALGAALTHPHITTDYSEAMIELVTPPGSLDESHAFLADLHRYVYDHLGGERLWCGSMPCVIAGDPDIPLARYGDSNPGRMKTIYRRGLGYRYTRSMQVISGVHFNCSMPDGFWKQEPGGPLDQNGISERYFGALRNLLRFGWLVAYLFGASPAICRSFVAQKHESLELFTPGTYYGPYATSLRQGSIGYQNSQETSTGVHADYNSRAGYIECLREATGTPCLEYQRIGVRRNGEYLQLNANQLQIENEYYSPVRPKCVPQGNEKPTRGLRQRGVEYVELRSLDVDPFEPCGIGPVTMRFLTALVVYCLLDDNLGMSALEQAAADYNMQRVAHCGRDPKVTLQRGRGPDWEAAFLPVMNDEGSLEEAFGRDGETVSLREWTEDLLEDIRPVCELLDEAHGQTLFQQAWQEQKGKVLDAEQTPSGCMVAQMRESGDAYVEWVLKQSQKHQEHFRKQPLDDELRTRFDQVAEQSRSRQQAIEEAERENPMPFEDYLTAYEAQA